MAIVKDEARDGVHTKGVAAADGAVDTQRDFSPTYMEWQDGQIDPHIETMDTDGSTGIVGTFPTEDTIGHTLVVADAIDPPPSGGGAGIPSLDGTPLTPVFSDAVYDYYTVTSDGDLTFEAAGVVEVELVGGGGGGGNKGWNRTNAGGGGAGARIVSLETVDDITTYPVVLGSGGAGGLSETALDAGDAVAPEAGASTVVFGITAPGGGFGGSKATSQGSTGACGGGNAHSSDAINGSYGMGSHGGAGTAGTSAEKIGGGGGGAGGDAFFLTKFDRLSTAVAGTAGGPGLPSLLSGVTVCAGGAGANETVNNTHGADGATPGSGGGGAAGGTGDVHNGGSGADGHVVIRVPKEGSAMQLAITEAGMSTDEVGTYKQDPVGWGYALRDGNFSFADVPVRGILTGSSEQIEARVIDNDENVVTAWTTLGTASNGVDFDFTIAVPTSALEHRIEARVKTRPEVLQRQRVRWHTSLTVVGYGQSNWSHASSQKGEQPPEAFPQDCFKMGCAGVDNGQTYIIYVASGPTVGAGLYEIVTGLRTPTAVPIMIVHQAQGGASIGILEDPTNPTMIGLKEGVKASGGLNAMIFHQGEGNAGSGSGDPAAYAAALESIRTQLADENGQTATDIPIVVSSLCTQAEYDNEGWVYVKDMQKDYLPANITNCHFAAPWDDAVRYDNFHCYAESYERREKREVRLLSHILGYDTDPGVFTIAAVEATDTTTTTVTLSHNNLGSDIEFILTPHLSGDGIVDVTTTPSECNSFEVSVDAWTTPVATTAVRTDATTITLTHASISTADRRLRYFYGARPGYAGGAGYDPMCVVRDNSAYSYPLQYETDLAAPAP